MIGGDDALRIENNNRQSRAKTFSIGEPTASIGEPAARVNGLPGSDRLLYNS
ncbi:MAG TPA: hypothetical protein VK749_21130 [Xanthobacteraceae bacterium]|nr:hypothetical protein [Xanthobacteraceae bacterium]